MALLPVRVVGNTLQTADNRRFKAVGSSEFAMFKRFLMPNGPTHLVAPILAERKELAMTAGYTGPLTARVFRCAGGANEFALDPWSYSMSAVAEFTQFLGERDWYVDWTGGDYQLAFPSSDPRWGEVNGPRGINQHNNVFCAAIHGQPNCFWNTSNEPFSDGKNGIDVSVVKPPPWAPVVQYSGLYYDGTWDNSTDLTCINLHTDRSTEGGVEKWVGKAHESAPFLWVHNKPIFYDEGMGADEITIPGRRSNVPAYFGVLGTVITMVDAVYFHSTPGLGSHGFGPVVKECYKAFCRGAKAGLAV